jgi:hypothetical protein
MDPEGKAHMKLWFYLILQGYFGYENDRTHVIKVYRKKGDLEFAALDQSFQLIQGLAWHNNAGW